MSEETPTTERKPDDTPAERSVSTAHHIRLNGQELDYTTTLSTLHLKDDAGTPTASIFSIALTLDGVDDPSSRPVTFCFNGGPGSSSVWLHIGALGTQRVDMADAVHPPPPPYRLIDNEESIFGETDLVFIDPVGTGFSRALGETKAEEFHSVKGDVDSVVEFIWRWLNRNGRWSSAKFLAGESYGTTRGAAIANALHARGVFLNGLVMVSLAMRFDTFIDEPGNDLPYLLFLPTYTATACFHGRIETPEEGLDALLAEVREWAYDVYAPALLRGDRLPPARRRELAEQLSRYTGLPADELERRRLRIAPMWFSRTVLGAGEQTVGRLDSRFVGPDQDPVATKATRDPSYDAPLGPYAALVNDHLRRTLGWTDADDYAVLSLEVNAAWKWQVDKRFGYLDVSQDLRTALLANPHLKVLFANGIYDLATPFFAAEYTAHHLNVDAQRQANVRLTYYDAGHMMYINADARKQLRDDLVDFYQDAVPR